MDSIYLFISRFHDTLAQQSWMTIHSFGEDVQNCLGVLDLMRSLPPTSVKNESSFSMMKLTKGIRRPRLKTSTLNDLLTVNLLTEPISQFDPDKSIEYFLVSKFWRFLFFLNQTSKLCLFITKLETAADTYQMNKRFCQ